MPLRSRSLIVTDEEKTFTASQWQLTWWRFRKHKLALACLVMLALFYLIAAFCEFVAPHDPLRYQATLKFAPPQRIVIVDEQGFHWPPFVYGQKSTRDPETLAQVFQEDKTSRYPLRLFVRGDPYRMWGLLPSDLHLFGIQDDTTMLLLLGADKIGRDVLSRLVYGARISLSIGFVGVLISLSLGIVIGGISGYYGGPADILIQRVIEFLRSLPGVPLWMTLAAALPLTWSPLQRYFAITAILSLLSWTDLARVVRGKFLSLRTEDFVLAAKLAGASEMRIILRHMVPSFTSHLIASLTLSIPAMILSETSLSFLGLGLQAPTISWGVLLQGGQNVHAIALAPWLLWPGAAVVATVLSFSFVGDGLRDAVDPYA